MREAEIGSVESGKGRVMLYFRLSSFAAIAMFAGLLAYRARNITGMARTYPMVLIVEVIAGLSLLIAMELVRRQSVPATGDIVRFRAMARPLRMRFLGFVGAWLAYPWLLDTIGFIVATTLTLSLSFWLLRMRRIGYGVLGAIAFAFGCAILCATVFYIPLPPGPIDEWVGKMLFAMRH